MSKGPEVGGSVTWIRNWKDERKAVWLKHVNMSGEEEKVGRRNCQRGQITPALVGQGEEFGSHCVTVKQASCHDALAKRKGRIVDLLIS